MALVLGSLMVAGLNRQTMEVPPDGFSMRSGFGEARGMDPHMEGDVAASLRVFVELSAEDAAEYAAAAGRADVLPRDVALGLTANAVGDFWARPDLAERLQAARAEYDEPSSDEGEVDGEDEEEDEEAEEVSDGGSHPAPAVPRCPSGRPPIRGATWRTV